MPPRQPQQTPMYKTREDMARLDAGLSFRLTRKDSSALKALAQKRQTTRSALLRSWAQAAISEMSSASPAGGRQHEHPPSGRSGKRPPKRQGKQAKSGSANAAKTVVGRRRSKR
jgi:hypothetical protein